MNFTIDRIYSIAQRAARGEFSSFDYVKLSLERKLSSLFRILRRMRFAELPVPIKSYQPGKSTAVESYWEEHTVNSLPFKTRWESQKYYEWLKKNYPLLDRLMDFSLDRSNQVVLDYGCGPGNDIFRFLVINHTQKVIGMDVSSRALELSRLRMSLYDIDPGRLELVQCPDTPERLPIESESIDHVNCAGVLHHTTNPKNILKEFHRGLKPGGSINIMVYNRDSIFYHLYIAYSTMIVKKKYPGLEIDAVFTRSTDGENCPISKANRPEEFFAFCRDADFEVEYAGGYFDRMELYWAKHDTKKAIKDPRLPEEHKEFLNNIEFDKQGYPMCQGKYAGIGGVYKLRKSY